MYLNVRCSKYSPSSTLVPHRCYQPNFTDPVQPVKHGRSGALPPFHMAGDSTATNRDDRTVLLKLFRQCSRHHVRDSPVTHLDFKWFKWTGWSTNHPLANWHGVGTMREDDGAEGRERVTSLVLPKTRIRGKKDYSAGYYFVLKW